MRSLRRRTRALAATLLAVVGASSCRGFDLPGPIPPASAMPPQTVVLFATPKFLPDFDAPDSAVARFLDHYAPLTTRAAETVVVFAVGNAEHILTYPGRGGWQDTVQWASQTDGRIPPVQRTMRYAHLPGIVRAFRQQAAARGLTLRIVDQVDQGDEITLEFWKFNRHPECMDLRWRAFDVRGRLRRDPLPYASAPRGIAEGKNCGEFIVDQIAAYVGDVGFDGILYGNQFGTRGQWLPKNGPGWSADEERGIRDFLAYSRRALGDRLLVWFDSYNNTQVEHDTWSFPADGYAAFDYLMASGFCVITETPRYLDNLESKLKLQPRPRVLATLDWVDPWYSYNSMTAYPGESAWLEKIAIRYRDRIAGLVFFANDERGQLVPADRIRGFAERFWGDGG